MVHESSPYPDGVNGWATKPLGEICSIVSGGTPPKSDPSLWKGDLPWASGKDMKKPRLRDTIDHITAEAGAAYSRIAPAGSVLVLVRGMGLANGFAVSLLERPMAFNQDLKALIPSEEVTGAFLMYALTWAGQRMLQNVSDAAHGTKRLSQDDVTGFELSYPTTKEQNAIASVLDTTRAAIDVESQAIRFTESFRLAAMHELFTRGLRKEEQKETEIGPLPGSWSVVSLGSLGRIGNGSTPKKTVAEFWRGGTFPWLTSAKVYDRAIYEAEEYVTDVALQECHLPVLHPGAVLIAITGQGKTLGHCAVLRMKATISQHLAYLQPDLARANPRFVTGYLETKYSYFRQVASGGGSTKGALTCAFLRELSVPLPGLIEQNEIATILEAIDRKVELHRRKRDLLNDLFSSLVQKLMTGAVRVSDLRLSVLSSVAAGSA